MEEFKGFRGWLRGIFSESDGTPSASRFVMFMLACVASSALLILCHAIVKSEAARAGLILAALPGVLLALTGFIVAPYSWNQLKNGITGISDLLKSKTDPPKQ
jgi:hypothetical protein